MRKRLNIKLLLGLVFGSAAFMIGVYVVHGIQVKRNSDSLRRRADAARDGGDLTESIRLRRRFLAHNPDDATEFKKVALDAKKYLFDKVARRESPKPKDVKDTIFLMEEATRKNPKDPEIRREGADLWFAMKRYGDAVSNLEVIRSEWTTEDKLRYIECLRLSGSPTQEQDAINELSRMIGYDPETDVFDISKAETPDMFNAYQSLIILLIDTRNERDLAERTVNYMVDSNSENADAYLTRSRLIRYIRGADGKEVAQSDIDKAFELAQDNREILAAKARMLMEKGETDQAKDLVNKALQDAEEMNDKSRLYNLLAQIYITARDTQGAMALLDKANREVPADRELLWTKARLLLDDKQFEEVEKMYPLMEKALAKPARIAYLQARILMEQGDYLNATKALSKIRPLVTPMLQYDIDVYLSAGYGMTKQYDLRLETIRRILAVKSDNVNAHEQYISTLIALGRNTEAIQYTNNLISDLESKGLPVSETLLGTQIQLTMTRELSESTEKLADRDLKKIQKDLAKFYQNKDIPAEQRYRLLIDYYRRVGNNARAKQAVEAALKEVPASKSFTFWALRIDYSESEEEALETYSRMASTMDEKFEPLMRPMKAKIALKFSPETANDVIQQQEQNVDKFTNQQRADLFFQLGQLQLYRNNRNDGLRLLELASKNDPTRLDILNALFSDATRQSDLNRINEIVNRMQSVTGTDDDAWRLAESARIVWMIRNGHVAEAQKAQAISNARSLMQEARRNRPQHVPILLLESEIQSVSGDVPASLRTLESAHQLQPANPDIIRVIADTHRKLGDVQRFDEWMRKLPLSMRSERDKRVELTALWSKRSYWKAEDAQKAIQLTNEIVPESSEKPEDWLLKSAVFTQVKQYEGAEKAALRAKELNSSLPEVWTNLISVLVEQNKHAAAQGYLQEADGELLEKDKPITLGRCYVLLGNYSLAKSSLMTALRNDPKNVAIKRMIAEIYLQEKDAARATALVKQIMEEADPATDLVTLHWARRQMARTLGSTDSYTAFKQALELIEANTVEGKLSEKDLALWVFLCFVRPERSSWERALIRLDQVEKERPLNDDELFMKAQIYEKYGDEARWQEAKSMATSVLSRNPGNPKVIDNFVKWLLKRGEVREAKQLASNSMAENMAIRLLVEFHSYAKAGEIQKAMDKFKRSIPSDPNTQEELSTLLTLALMAEDLGQYNKGFFKLSEQLLTKLTEKRPNEVLRLATAKGLHGDLAGIREGLKLCMGASKVGVKDAFSTGVGIAILREHPEKWDKDLASSVSEFETWLNSMAQNNPDDLVVQWRLAEFHDMVGDLAKARAQYQKLLDSSQFENPYERGMVLNNLAYVMALSGDGESPVELVQQAEDLLGPTADLIDTRGYVEFVRGNTDAAIALFDEAIKAGPETAHKLFHSALAHNKKGDTATAELHWNKALDLGLSQYKLPKALHGDFGRLEAAFGNTGP